MVRGKRPKKKAAKPVNISVVMLKKFQKLLPKGKARRELAASKRIKKIQVTRIMSALQVKNVIVRAFSEIPGLNNFAVLEADEQQLCRASYGVDDLTGEVAVDRRGSLYLCEVDKVSEY